MFSRRKNTATGVVCLPDHPSIFPDGYSSTWLFCNNKKLSLKNIPTCLSQKYQFLVFLDWGHRVTTSLGSIVSGPAKASVPLFPNSAPAVRKKDGQHVDSQRSKMLTAKLQKEKNFNYKSTNTFVAGSLMFIHDFQWLSDLARRCAIWKCVSQLEVLSNLQLQL